MLYPSFLGFLKEYIKTYELYRSNAKLFGQDTNEINYK